jgi:hypothetical protein
MKKLARIFFGLAGCALLALVLMPLTEHRAVASNPSPVVVTNTPLPVQGTVAVGNTPSVNVANTASVNVTNTAVPIRGNVQVFNPLDAANNPIPLTVSTAGEPYADQCNTSGSASVSCNMNPLPSGKRLVIQAISIHASYGQSENVYQADLVTTVNGASALFLVTLSDSGLDGAGNLNKTGSVPTQFYADAGSTPQCQIDGTAGMRLLCTISGYLVP